MGIAFVLENVLIRLETADSPIKNSNLSGRPFLPGFAFPVRLPSSITFRGNHVAEENRLSVNGLQPTG